MAKGCIRLALVIALLFLPGPASASGYEPGNLHIGVTGAYRIPDGDPEGPTFGWEIAGSYRFLGIPIWGAQGWRFTLGKGVDAHFYYEAGFWALFNLGGGIGFGGTRLSPVQIHLFAGLPIPLVGILEKEFFPGFFIEPFYRGVIAFGPPRAEALADPTGLTWNRVGQEYWTHEFGIILKMTSLKIKLPWEEDEEEAAKEPMVPEVSQEGGGPFSGLRRRLP